MNYLVMSKRWYMDYGQGFGDLTGLNHYDVHPDLPDEWKNVHRRAIAGEAARNDEDMWLQADGSRHWLSWSVDPWSNENGAIGGIVISSENITARKEAEVVMNSRKLFLTPLRPILLSWMTMASSLPSTSAGGVSL